MTKSQIADLQSIITGQFYSTAIIDAAIAQAEKLENLEAQILLKNLKAPVGQGSTVESCMTLQRFVCDLSDNLT